MTQGPMALRRSLAAVLLILLTVPITEGANLKRPDGDAEAGRELAISACTGCHVASADQPFAPLLTGPPDFLTIANRPGVTAASLRRRIATLAHVPLRGQMANPLLNSEELTNVVAYIMTLRERRANQ